MMNTSYPSGARTVSRLLSYRADHEPDAVFSSFLHDNDSDDLSYAQAWEMAQSGARLLANAGVGAGATFAVMTDNCREFFACWFGAALLGAVIVPISPRSSVDEIAFIIGHAQCRLLICGQERGAELPADLGVPVITCGADFEAHSQGSSPPNATVGPEWPLAVMYTSGTTGRPKGVVVTHANYVEAGTVVANHLRMRPDDRWMVCLPLFHANAQYYCVMSALVTGASVAVAPRFSATRWPAQIRRSAATLASLFAAPMRMILAQQGPDTPTSLRATIFAQNLTPGQLEEFQHRFDTALVQIYGMTETIAPVLMNPLHDRRDNMTVGLPVRTGAVRVLTADGRDAEIGEIGELLVAGSPGSTLMAGYLHDETATAEAFLDGWLRTGDLVTIDEHGYFSIVDRKKNMIKRAGENVAAAEVERVVNLHPGVFECAVVGEPDPVRDERIRAFVVLEPGHGDVTGEDTIAYCTRHLADFKVPSVVDIVGSLPHTAVGKVQKHRLGAASSGVRKAAP
ncbi:class I adenylate-forming enzyme family protein [Nocardia sp. bgisy134]|uniref:class I adenylate-forming enzyme family protein n=1 Tax=Nocardia sp. bgisy134 TaxID=3413789 RepID=UPI003D76445D